MMGKRTAALNMRTWSSRMGHSVGESNASYFCIFDCTRLLRDLAAPERFLGFPLQVLFGLPEVLSRLELL